MTDTVENVAAAELRQFIERIERLEEEKAAISDDIKDVKAEAKGRGYDTKAINTIIKLRKKDASERAEEETILATYMAALGMLPVFEPEQPSARLVKQVVDGMQTEVGRAALLSAVDIMIERVDAEEENMPETAKETVGGFPVAAAPTSAEETGAIQPTRQGAGMERGMHPSVTGGESAAINHEMDRATEGSFETGSAAAEKGREAIPAGPEGVDLTHAGAGESPAAIHPILRKTVRDYRPRCLKPDACGASGLQHCFSCTKAMASQGEPA